MQTSIKVFNPRDLVKIENGKIHINEDDIDLFQYPEYELPEWKPKIKIPEYKTCSMLVIDIETSGGIIQGSSEIDFENHSIELIGLQNEQSTNIIINCLKKDIDLLKLIDNLNIKNPRKYSINNICIINAGDEKAGLQEFLKILYKKNPDFVSGFNSFNFDLPFIIEKLNKHKLNNPFWINPKPTIFATAQKWGKPSIYNSIWLNTYPKGKTCIIDLYHQLLKWDFVARKLTSYSLKQAVLQTKLRSEARLELSYEQMREVVKNGEIEKYFEYLVYDLEDTKLLADFLIPSIYYQKLFLPDWKLQSISHSGNGSKLNDILKKYYLSKNKKLPETSDKLFFQGGLTGANAGIFLNVSKIDVASLYPNIMLTYCICSDKDVDKYQLAVLKYLLDFRLALKEKKKNETATTEEKRTEGAYKETINSEFGLLGTGGLEFNDYVAAALITAYGRAILKLMMSVIEKHSGKIASIDTDGIYYSTDDVTFEKNVEIYKKVQSFMPKGINLDYELEAKCFYVPPNTVKKIESELVIGTEDDQPGLRNDGLKKNYIIIDKKGEIKCKGKYVKRDRCVLEKEFQPEVVRLLTKNKEEAYNYFQNVIQEMKLGVYDIENLKITRRIRKGEKSILNLGKEGDQIVYYFAEPETIYGKRGQPLKNKIEVKTVDGTPGWEYYQELTTKMFNEIWQFTN